MHLPAECTADEAHCLGEKSQKALSQPHHGVEISPEAKGETLKDLVEKSPGVRSTSTSFEKDHTGYPWGIP